MIKSGVSYTLMAMIQSGVYIPSPKIAIGGRMDRDQMEATWRMSLRPKKADKKLMCQVFFPQQPGKTNRRWYNNQAYDQPTNETMDGYDAEGSCLMSLSHMKTV